MSAINDVKNEIKNNSYKNLCLINFFNDENKLGSFNYEVYKELLQEYGLEITWNIIIEMISSCTVDDLSATFLRFDDLGELYEIGLALTNKISKKEMGKYYTPNDVAKIMSELLLENDNISELVDVASGTGNLVLEVIRQMLNSDKYDVVTFITNRRLWLFDADKIALNICIAKIEILLQHKVSDYINVIEGDFLDRKITLPNNATVITNPPYSVFKEFDESWEQTDVLRQSKDLYAGFIDKIITSCQNAVIVTPQSYLVADKFSKLRNKLAASFYGEIFAFDNVPGTLFNGRKHGVFNTNSSNGVRAAIASIRRNGHQGFKLSHLIRFRSSQRVDIMNLKFLRTKLGTKVQDLVNPIKSFKELEPFVDVILEQPHVYISQLIETDLQKQEDRFKIHVSSSARYFTVGSIRKLNRVGCYEIYAKNEQNYKLLYALLNSSYVYMWWRFFDGGIIFSKKNLLRVPVSVELLENNCLDRANNVIQEMIENESNYLSYKKNAGKNQESIKFPVEYRNFINRELFNEYSEYFGLLHNNYEVKDDEV